MTLNPHELQRMLKAAEVRHRHLQDQLSAVHDTLTSTRDLLTTVEAQNAALASELAALKGDAMRGGLDSVNATGSLLDLPADHPKTGDGL